jgi:hypothetical protein
LIRNERLSGRCIRMAWNQPEIFAAVASDISVVQEYSYSPISMNSRQRLVSIRATRSRASQSPE